MGKYSVYLSKKAQKQLDKLPDVTALPLLEAIASLEIDPRPHGSKKLKGRNGHRIRVGDYRIIYEILDSQLIVDIVTVGHRRDVYE